MGTWATGIYDDDIAQDARDAYRAILNSGLDGPAATDRFLQDWKGALKDSDDGPVIWFALSETQWTLGRLEDRIRDAAIKIIDDGSSLNPWREEGGKLAEKRQAVLLALKQKLLSPQPAKKAIKVRKPSQIATWRPGELVAFRLRSGRLVVLCLESIDKEQHADLSALDWIGDSLPDSQALGALPRKRIVLKGKLSKYTLWGLIGSKQRDVPYDRMVRLGVRIPPEKNPVERRWTEKFWNRLDVCLEELFGWT